MRPIPRGGPGPGDIPSLTVTTAGKTLHYATFLSLSSSLTVGTRRAKQLDESIDDSGWIEEGTSDAHADP